MNINRTNIITWSLSIITVIVLLVFGYAVYTMVRPYNIVELQTPLKVTNLNKEVKPGEILEVQITYQKHYPFLGTITEHLVNGVTTTITSGPSNVRVTAPGEWATFVRPIHIPDRTMPGQYYIRLVTHYEPNPFRTITQTWNSEVFTVVGECEESSLRTIKKELNQILQFQKKHKLTSEENNQLLKQKMIKGKGE
jgi:hypothetical protein